MRIALLGDIAPINSFDVSGWNKNDWATMTNIASYLAQFDYVVGNFECPFSKARKRWGAKSAYLCCDPINVQLLKALHINYVNLANNHLFDYGKEGYELTKKILTENQIDWFGCEGKSILLSDENNKIAFEGFCCYSTNPQMNVKYGNYGINELDLDMVRLKLKMYKSKGILPVISIHAGTEHVNYPSAHSIEAARDLTQYGPYIYYGHHPHVLQGVEIYQDSLIAHSLGNFIFDDIYAENGNCQVKLSQNNRTSCILELTVENNVIVSYKTTPFFIGKGKINLDDNPPVKIEKLSFIEEYTDSPARYMIKRKALIDSYMVQRKSKRNLGWYFKRLKIRYLKLFITNRNNKKKYLVHFVRKSSDK